SPRGWSPGCPGRSASSTRRSYAPVDPLCQIPHVRLCLLQPERHAHFAISLPGVCRSYGTLAAHGRALPSTMARRHKLAPLIQIKACAAEVSSTADFDLTACVCATFELAAGDPNQGGWIDALRELCVYVCIWAEPRRWPSESIRASAAGRSA